MSQPGQRCIVRAAVLPSVGAALEVTELELAPPGPGEVLVRLHSSGVCHSDWNAVSGDYLVRLPAVLGHEGAGVVDVLGEEVTHLVPGDQVVLSWLPSCGRCPACQQGRLSLCETATLGMAAGALPSGAVRFSRGGKAVHHYSYLSTFATSVVVAEQSCVRLAPSADLEVAALVGCAVMTGIGAVVNRARVTPGASVAVFGAGGVGLSVVMGARLAGAGRIIVVDPVASKRQLAIELGASEALDPAGAAVGEVAQKISELTGGGADYAFEAAGITTLVEEAFFSTRPGGMVVAVGIPSGEATVRLPGSLLTRSERVVTGTFYGSARPHLDMPMILDLHAQGRLPLEKLISRRYPLEGVNQAFEDMHRGEVARGVLSLADG